MPCIIHKSRIIKRFFALAATAALCVLSALPAYAELSEEGLKQHNAAIAAARLDTSGNSAITSDGRRIRIAVIDTGVEASHPAFTAADGSCSLSPLSYNATTQLKVQGDSGVCDWSVISDQTASDYHGTGVAAVIGAQPSCGIGGIAPDAELVIIKCSYYIGSVFAETDVIRALQYAIDIDADVISLSFGFSTGTKAREIAAMCEKAEDKGIICVASAGNGGYTAVDSPSSSNSVLSVGALNTAGDNTADFSNRGTALDVVAPGTVYTAARNGEFRAESGTSYSAPIAAGAAALFLARFPDSTPQQFFDAVRATAADLGTVGRDDETGYGSLDIAALLSCEKGKLTLSDEKNGSRSIAFIGGITAATIGTPSADTGIFGGWYYDEELTEPLKENGVVTESATLYAKWSALEDIQSAEVTGWKYDSQYHWSAENKSDKAEHSFVKTNVVQSSFGKSGFIERTCTVCGCVVTEELKPKILETLKIEDASMLFSEGLTVRSGGGADKLQYVDVDEMRVSGGKYSVSADGDGCVIVIGKEVFEPLADGIHTITVGFSDNCVSSAEINITSRMVPEESGTAPAATQTQLPEETTEPNDTPVAVQSEAPEETGQDAVTAAETPVSVQRPTAAAMSFGTIISVVAVIAVLAVVTVALVRRRK